jgi:hypothetical protein
LESGAQPLGMKPKMFFNERRDEIVAVIVAFVDVKLERQATFLARSLE